MVKKISPFKASPYAWLFRLSKRYNNKSAEWTQIKMKSQHKMIKKHKQMFN